MIHISENLVGEDEVRIRVEGVLDEKTVSLLKDICSQHLEKNKRVFLHLGGLLDISREGVEFLRENDARVVFVDAPKFVRLWTCG
jgi:hypothetical protein